MPYQIIWSWYTGRWWVGCYVWYSDEGTGRGPSPPRPLIAVPNVTAHPSTANVPITVLMYNDPLPCGFNVPIKGLSKCLHGLAPSYRADDCVLASAAAGRRHLRSADTMKLLVRRTRSEIGAMQRHCIDEWADIFAVSAAAIWNSLPASSFETVFLLGSDICAGTENYLRQRDDVAHYIYLYSSKKW